MADPDLPLSRRTRCRAHDHCRRAAHCDPSHAARGLVCCTIGPLAGLVFLISVCSCCFSTSPTSCMSGGSIRHFRSPRPCRGARGFCSGLSGLAANALAHLPEAIPALRSAFPVLIAWSDFILSRTRLVVAIGIANVLVGIGLGIYTGSSSVLSARASLNSACLVRSFCSPASLRRPRCAWNLVLTSSGENCQRSPTSCSPP